MVRPVFGCTRWPKNYLLVWIIAHLGLRVGEAFALRRRHIDLDAGALEVDSNLMENAVALQLVAGDAPQSGGAGGWPGARHAEGPAGDARVLGC